MASVTVRSGDDGSLGSGDRRRLLPRRWFLIPIGVFAVAALWAGIHTWRDYRVLTSAKYNVINYTVPDRAASRRRHRRDGLPHRPDAVAA